MILFSYLSIYLIFDYLPFHAKRNVWLCTNHHLVWFVTTSAGCTTPTTPLAWTTPMKAHEGPQQAMSLVFRAFLYVFILFLFLLFNLPTVFFLGLRVLNRDQQTTTNNNKPPPQKRRQQQQRHQAREKKGPNNARRVIWALGIFFLFFSSILLTTKAYSSQRRPQKANVGPRKPTAAND